MRLEAYLDRVYDLLHSRRDLSIESFSLVRFPAEQSVVVEGRLRYWDSSLLRFYESVGERGLSLIKVEYVYQYQSGGGSLIFRYDNAPHHPEISSHPHHKHVGGQSGERIEAAHPPGLTEVLREIEGHLYPDQSVRP